MTRDEMAKVMARGFEEGTALREAGQKEYAHDDGNAFANFEADAEAYGVSREIMLLVFGGKHWRGIQSWARGHRSQRENVRGRINDLIVYLCLLRGMVEEMEERPPQRVSIFCACGHMNTMHRLDRGDLTGPLICNARECTCRSYEAAP